MVTQISCKAAAMDCILALESRFPNEVCNFPVQFSPPHSIHIMLWLMCQRLWGEVAPILTVHGHL